MRASAIQSRGGGVLAQKDGIKAYYAVEKVWQLLLSEALIFTDHVHCIGS